MSWMEALVPCAGVARPMTGVLLLLWQAALAGGVPPPGDFQYFLPQEFLLDLPIREGSFATEVMNTLRSLNFPDVHAKDVDAGVFENVYATSDLNAPAYKAGRRICTRVPPGYNEADDPNLCEREGATAPQAIINSPTPGVAYSEGNFHLVAEFEVDIVGYLHVWTQTCLVLCWENQLCNDDITINGAFRVTSSVEVGRQPVTGQISLLPSTSFKFLEGPFTTGCREDWVASLFADVDNEISVAVRTLMEKWVRKNLQSQLQTQQRVQLMPRLTMIYQIVKLDFVPDWGSEHERGYVRVCAVTTVQATAANGTVQSFPDPLQAWTGRHNPTPLSPAWNRTIWYGEAQRVLLGGVRFSQEMLTMLFQGMHFAGVLSPHGSSIVHDAQVLSHVDVAQPTLRIREEGQGALLEEPTLQVGVACPDTSHGSGVFRLLDATFSGVAQRVIVSSYVAKDHSAMGLTLALSDVSLATANMTAFSSSTFFGSEGHLKALAERALRSAMPRLNRRLARAPLLFCGGGGSSCALVPLVPHPEVRTVPEQGLGRPGFVQLSWACSCTAGGQYQRCKGHICPRQAQLESQERRLRGGPGDGGVVVKARPAQHKHNPGTLYLATFSPVRSAEAAHCVFASAGDTLRFGALRPSRARVATAPGAEDLLGTAYRLERQPHGRFRLHLGCDAKSTAPCRYHTQPVRLHECGILKPSGPQAQDDEGLLVPFFLSRVSTLAPAAASLAAGQPAASSPSASPSGCLGGHKDYGQNDTLLMAVVGGASSASATPFTFAVHLGDPGSASGCVPCGVDGNLWCSAEPSSTSATSLSASLLCKQCSSGVPNGCLLGGSSDASANQARLGQWFEVLAGSTSVRNPGGYSKVTLVTRQTVPLLQPCPRPKQEPQPLHKDWLSMAPIALAASAGVLVMAASVAGGYLLKGRTCCSCCSHRATRVLPRLHFRPPEDNLQSMAHGLLWVGASLLLACGLVWLLENPLVHLLDEMRATTDMHNGFDNEVADRIVQRSCYVGLAIFAASASLLAALSLSMLFVLEWPCLSSTGVEVEALIANEKREDESVEDNREVQPLWDLSFWFPAVVFLLSESNSAFAFLAFCFWRRAGGNFTLLGGDTYAGETTTAVFSIRLLLTWIAPFLLATHSLPIATLVAYTRGLASSVTSGERWRMAGAAQPFVLASVLVNASIELILSIVYYRSGYGRIWVLYIMLGGVSMNVVTFLVLAPRSRPSRSSADGSDEVVDQAGCCSLAAYPLLVLQVAGTGALLVCLADRCACARMILNYQLVLALVVSLLNVMFSLWVCYTLWYNKVVSPAAVLETAVGVDPLSRFQRLCVRVARFLHGINGMSYKKDSGRHFSLKLVKLRDSEREFLTQGMLSCVENLLWVRNSRLCTLWLLEVLQASLDLLHKDHKAMTLLHGGLGGEDEGELDGSFELGIFHEGERAVKAVSHAQSKLLSALGSSLELDVGPRNSYYEVRNVFLVDEFVVALVSVGADLQDSIQNLTELEQAQTGLKVSDGEEEEASDEPKNHKRQPFSAWQAEVRNRNFPKPRCLVLPRAEGPPMYGRFGSVQVAPSPTGDASSQLISDDEVSLSEDKEPPEQRRARLRELIRERQVELRMLRVRWEMSQQSSAHTANCPANFLQQHVVFATPTPVCPSSSDGSSSCLGEACGPGTTSQQAGAARAEGERHHRWGEELSISSSEEEGDEEMAGKDFGISRGEDGRFTQMLSSFKTHESLISSRSRWSSSAAMPSAGREVWYASFPSDNQSFPQSHDRPPRPPPVAPPPRGTKRVILLTSAGQQPLALHGARGPRPEDDLQAPRAESAWGKDAERSAQQAHLAVRAAGPNVEEWWLTGGVLFSRL